MELSQLSFINKLLFGPDLSRPFGQSLNNESHHSNVPLDSDGTLSPGVTVPAGPGSRQGVTPLRLQVATHWQADSDSDLPAWWCVPSDSVLRVTVTHPDDPGPGPVTEDSPAVSLRNQ